MTGAQSNEFTWLVSDCLNHNDQTSAKLLKMLEATGSNADSCNRDCKREARIWSKALQLVQVWEIHWSYLRQAEYTLMFWNIANTSLQLTSPQSSSNAIRLFGDATKRQHRSEFQNKLLSNNPSPFLNTNNLIITSFVQAAKPASEWADIPAKE